MKSYLLIPLIFLYALCSPVLAFSQDNTATSPSADYTSSEPQRELETKGLPDYTMPDTWPDHFGHEAPEREPVERESDTFQTKFFNMLFILGLLIGFMLLASWALKRMMKSKMTQLNTASNIKVLETRYLSPRATLYLVEIENQTFLIAESPTSVSYLATLSQQHESS